METRSFFAGLILALVPICLQAQWVETTSTTDQILYDIAFSAENKGWAVGLGGTILHYDGVEWQTFSSLEGNQFARLEFTSGNEGWAIDINGKIFRYDGNNWSLNFTTTGNKKLFTLHFLETGEGFVSGDDGYIAYYDGKEWSEGNIGFDIIALTSYFADNKNGWLSSGAGVMYQFKDSTWSEVTVPGLNAFNEMEFVSPDNGYGVGFDNTIWHYNGDSWSVEYTSINNTNQFLTDIYFLDKDHGWAAGQGSFFSYQYGKWKEEEVDPDWEIWGFYFKDPYHGWAVGSHGLILEYGPEPLNWRPVDDIPSSFLITEISRDPMGILYVIGHNEGVFAEESEVGLYKSSNGVSWQRISSSLDELFKTNAILAAQDLLLVSGIDKDFNQGVYQSVDGGQTWTISNEGLSERSIVEDMTMDESGTIYAIANHDQPELYKSEDLGVTWTLMATNGFPIPADGSRTALASIASLDTKLFAFHVYQGATSSGIYTSTDGENWTKLANTPRDFLIIDLHVSEDGSLYASGGSFTKAFGDRTEGSAYVSSDQGKTWELINTSNLGDYRAIYYSIATLNDNLFLSTINANVTLDHKVFTTSEVQAQSITFETLPNKTYGDDAFIPVASAASGLPVKYSSSDPEVALIVDNAVKITGAGTSTITASQPGNDLFLPANNVDQLLTINKADLNVTVTNTSRPEGEPNPDFELNYTGWIGGDNMEDLDVKPVASTSADVASIPGDYPIIITGGMDNNYNFGYAEGILTVNERNKVTALNDHSKKGVVIFPNPVSDKLSLIQNQTVKSGHVLVYNPSGTLLRKERFSEEHTEIDFSTLPTGIYLLKIMSSKDLWVHKVVKE